MASRVQLRSSTEGTQSALLFAPYLMLLRPDLRANRLPRKICAVQASTLTHALCKTLD